MSAIPGPPPEQEVEHLAEQCATLLRENEQMQAEIERLRALVHDDAVMLGEQGREIERLKATLRDALTAWQEGRDLNETQICAALEGKP